MSAVEIDAGGYAAAAPSGADEISRRLESLPASSYVWRLVILLSLGGWFEVYDLFFTGYIAPGLNRSGLLTTTTQAFFGFSGIGAFVAATFAGLFVGTFFLGFLADRFGRRAIFTFALLGYTAASIVMACQTTSSGVLLWRFIAGIGIGVEIITIDAYITELVPSWLRGRAFAVNQAVMFTAVPVVAALAWWLVPLQPYGIDGWRWVVLITAANMTMSYAYHAYQTEVFPTAIRARAAGLVYSMSRVSATFSGFIVAFMLREAGVGGVFGLITTAMIIVIVAIAVWGPAVRGKPLDA
jgi:putative MFS transporter